METQKKYYYTYYSYEEWGRGYIGSRGCKCQPEQDTRYLGSFKDKTFNPTQKIILTQYNTREDAIAAEVKLHEFYDVANNPHFANKARVTEKFYMSDDFAKENGRKSYELSLGIHGLTKEERIEFNKENGKKGGKRTHELGVGVHGLTKEERIEINKRTYELGLGIHNRTKEERIEHAKKGAQITSEKYAREFVLMDPHGNIHKGRNVSQFCREYDLDRRTITKVLNGKLKQHKGYKLV